MLCYLAHRSPRPPGGFEAGHVPCSLWALVTEPCAPWPLAQGTVGQSGGVGEAPGQLWGDSEGRKGLLLHTEI